MNDRMAWMNCWHAGIAAINEWPNAWHECMQWMHVWMHEWTKPWKCLQFEIGEFQKRAAKNWGSEQKIQINFGLLISFKVFFIAPRSGINEKRRLS